MKQRTFLALLTVAMAPLAANGNLLTNPGFESGGGFGITGWSVSPNTEFVNPSSGGPTVHSGLKSVGLTDGLGETVNFLNSTPVIPAVAGETFSLSAWVKTVNFNGSDAVRVALAELDGSGSFLSFVLGPIVFPGESDWFQIVETLTTSNPSTARVSAYLVFLNSGLTPADATAYFDDVSLTLESGLPDPAHLSGLVISNAMTCIELEDLTPDRVVHVERAVDLPAGTWTELSTFTPVAATATWCGPLDDVSPGEVYRILQD